MLAVALAPLGFGSQPGATTTKQIYVIRHGEKTYNPYRETMQTLACLSQIGWGRAYNLGCGIFGRPARGGFDTPDYLFASPYRPINCRDEHGWYRTQQTISVVAYQLGFEVDTSVSFLANNPAFPNGPSYCDVNVGMHGCQTYGTDMGDGTHAWEAGMCCSPVAAAKMLEKMVATSAVNTILVSWEHVNIQWLAQALAEPHDIEALVDGDNWPGGNNYEIWFTNSRTRAVSTAGAARQRHSLASPAVSFWGGSGGGDESSSLERDRGCHVTTRVYRAQLCPSSVETRRH